MLSIYTLLFLDPVLPEINAEEPAPTPSRENSGVGRKGDRYSPEEIREWSYVLRRVANRLSDERRLKLARYFYNAHYAIGPEKPEMGMDPLELDPFLLDQDYLSLEDSGGVAGLIESLRVVAGKGFNYINPQVWRSGLGSYLNKLLIKLTKK